MKRLFSVLACVALLSSAAFAQQFAKTGVVEIGGNVGFSNMTGVSNGETAGNSISIFQINPTIGCFVTDGLELGINPLEFTTIEGEASGLTTMSSGAGGESQTMVGFWAFGAYNFSTGGPAFPYLQAQVGYTSESFGGSSFSGLSYGFAGGAKFKLAGGLLLNAGLSYKFYTYNPSGAENRFGMNILSVGVGISGFFGK